MVSLTSVTTQQIKNKYTHMVLSDTKSLVKAAKATAANMAYRSTLKEAGPVQTFWSPHSKRIPTSKKVGLSTDFKMAGWTVKRKI